MCAHRNTVAPPPYTPVDHAATARLSAEPRSQSRRCSNHRHAVTEQSPLLQIHVVPSSTREPEPICSSSCRFVLFILVIFIGVPFFMGGGAYIDRAMNQDTADPRVRQRIRQEWAAEERSWVSKLHQYERQANDTLHDLHQYERELEEKKTRETRRLLDLRLYWGNLQPEETCSGSGTKVYSGTLRNFDWSIDAFTACKATKVIINGIYHDQPQHCNVQRGGVITGVWTASGEAECSAYWEGMKDAGCTGEGSRTRRFEAHLSGVRPRDDAEALAICFSTPATIRNQAFDRPTSCPHFVFAGYFGVWEVPDSSCSTTHVAKVNVTIREPSRLRVLFTWEKPAFRFFSTDLLLSLLQFDQANMDRGALVKLFQGMEMSTRPLTVLPCANEQVYAYHRCSKPGTHACSSCRLVSYCSKECQREHWDTHRSDCRHKMRSQTWKPETSSPTNPFADFCSSFMGDYLSLSASLWGHTPACDVLALQGNLKAYDKDYNIAFAASGDLRHLVATIEGLPESYAGKLNVLLNDHNPWIVARNITLILILTQIQDLDLAADIAFHFRYSAFIPSEYRLQITALISSFLAGDRMEDIADACTFMLGTRCRASFVVPPETLFLCEQFCARTLTLENAQAEYTRVREAPSKRTGKDALYSGLSPSHRVAFLKYRQVGIILPHGASNARFNCPNNSLFSPSGVWMESYHGDPIGGWNLDEIIEGGRKHGATSEDVYGCFYFTITEKLKAVARHLKTFDVNLVVTNHDARVVPDRLSSGVFKSEGLPSEIRFDRIHVSNIMDEDYLGIKDTLVPWAPLLSKDSSATLIGYFMNWAKSSTWDAQSSHRKELKKGLQEMFQKTHPSKRGGLADLQFFAEELLGPKLYVNIADAHTYCDTSKGFIEYINEKGFKKLTEGLHLTLRTQNLIVPHRIGGKLGGSVESLPQFSGKDNRYLHTKLTSYTWTERFIELNPSKAG